MLAFGGLGGQDAEDGRTRLLQGGWWHPGRREDHDVALHALAAIPSSEIVACAPFVATDASSSDVSVFDNGLPARAHRLAARRRAGAPALPPGRRGHVGRRRWRPTSTTSCCAVAGPTAGRSTTWWPARERGLLLTCLWYIREVDPATLLMTGLTRDGVYVIEDGAVVGAANNFRFNESPVDLLARATEVGTPVRSLGPRVRRVPQPDDHAAPAHPRLQHELGEPGQLTAEPITAARRQPGQPGRRASTRIVGRSTRTRRHAG